MLRAVDRVAPIPTLGAERWGVWSKLHGTHGTKNTFSATATQQDGLWPDG